MDSRIQDIKLRIVKKESMPATSEKQRISRKEYCEDTSYLLSALSARDEALREAINMLHRTHEKLSLYRDRVSGEYIGGIEHKRLMDLIEGTITRAKEVMEGKE